EPTIDYVVTKIPRFTFEKFPQAESYLTTQMKSVGEVMAIGRDFKESMQKALRGLETGATGFDPIDFEGIEDIDAAIHRALVRPGDKRPWYIAEAIRRGWSMERLFEATKIDPWFMDQLFEIIEAEQAIEGKSLADLDVDQLRLMKQMGFSDTRIATLLNVAEDDVRAHRRALSVLPVYKRVDTCAAEFATETAYLYSTYDEECEAAPTDAKKIIVLGGGPNRIGQGIEFDYCCVHASQALSEAGYETIMVNCNPETVSTDYDTSDRLYFEPLTLEDVLEIVRVEQPHGVIVQYGGQTPLKLARALEAEGVPIIGTSPDSIDWAEDRERFQALVEELGLLQPPNRLARAADQATALAEEIGYPLVVRPSYVLGGRAMEIVHDEQDLQRYMREAVKVSNDSPVLLDRFLDDAIEVDVDCICDGQDVYIGGIMEHIEQAGVHSGDSACSLPPYNLPLATQDRIIEQVRQLALALNVRGLMNTQFAVKGEEIYLLEVNPRASRTAPFVSKATGVPLAKLGALVMSGKTLKELGVGDTPVLRYYNVKESVFPFAKFPGVDPLLGPEMKSTGEVMGVGRTFGEAFLKGALATGVRLPHSGTVLISVRDTDKPAAVRLAHKFAQRGFKVVATGGTFDAIRAANVECERVNKIREGSPHIVDRIIAGDFDLIINTTEGKQAIADSYAIRREALNHQVPYTTTVSAGNACLLAIQSEADFEVYKLQDLHEVAE
ncbi:MAG: carbamoyl-phosphate synthase large subunit, partial [Gammaproteobacteria bacterium]|nr:carbamoyl-phosphate synthase large subunit [Gammaproteobacteria bacterium]